MINNGFGAFKPKGNYLVAAAMPDAHDAPHVGQLRVSFQFDRCSEATIIAQQFVNDKDETTFRKWNPEKLNAPKGESTYGDAENANCGICYCICMLVNGCFNVMFEEVIDHAKDGTQTS